MENLIEHKKRAEQIARSFERQNLLRKTKNLVDEFQFIQGEHTPLSWRVEGDELVVVLNSGPKIRGPLKAPNVIEQAVENMAAAFASDEPSERQKLLDAREEELAEREQAVLKAAERLLTIEKREADLAAREKLLEDTARQLEEKAAQVVDTADGISAEEASTAGKALQAKKAEKVEKAEKK